MNFEFLLAISLQKGLLKPIEKFFKKQTKDIHFICVYKVACVQSSERFLKN